jgi:adenylate cyclase
VRLNFNFRKYFSWIIVVFFCIFFSLVFNLIDIFLPIENIFYDLRFKIRGPKKPSDKIVIVKIDEKSLAELGRWPWDRKVVAKIVENLVSSGAEIVALDIIFPEKSVPESDNKLAAALAKGKTVVAAHFETMYENVLKGNTVKKVLVEKLIFPIPQIQKVAKIGFANVEPDKDGVVRNMVLYKNYEDKTIYSFNFVVIKEYIDNMSIISTLPQKIYINYYGPSEYYDKKAGRIISTFVGYSAVNIYRNVIPPAWLKDKIVLIGSTATGAYDHYPTPYIHTYPGVELHATVIENILSHTYCKKFNKGYLLLISVAIGIILGIVFYKLVVLPTISLIFIFVIGYYLLTYFIFVKFYTIIDFVPVALNIVLIGVSNLSYKLFFEQREKKLIKKVFSKYINPYIMERLLEDPAGSLSVLGGQKREITVAFADIRGLQQLLNILLQKKW